MTVEGAPRGRLSGTRHHQSGPFELPRPFYHQLSRLAPYRTRQPRRGLRIRRTLFKGSPVERTRAGNAAPTRGMGHHEDLEEPRRAGEGQVLVMELHESRREGLRLQREVERKSVRTSFPPSREGSVEGAEHRGYRGGQKH